MPHAVGGRRIAETEKLSGREARRAELSEPEEEKLEPLSDGDLAALATHVREVIEHGDPPQRKALLQAMVAEIRVVSRAEIFFHVARGSTTMQVSAPSLT